MRRVILTSLAAAALMLSGCGKTATLLMNGNLPAGSETSEKFWFNGGEHWSVLRPYQNAYSGNVYGGEVTYHIRNTTAEDICVRITFPDTRFGRNRDVFGIDLDERSGKQLLVPARNRVIAATISAHNENTPSGIVLHYPGLVVVRSQGPTNGAC